MSKRKFTPAGSSGGDWQRQMIPGGGSVAGEDGSGPSQPCRVSPHGDMARCECVHHVTIRREMITFRCTTFLGDTDFEFGWRFCSRCRPPFVLVTRRARRITRLVLACIQELGLELDPPLDPETSRLRHLGILARRMRPWCQCICDRCLHRIRFDHDTPAARRQRDAEDLQAARDDITLIILSQDAGMALWATQVWIPTGTMGEWKNTMLAMVHNIWIGVLDRLGPVPDQEDPLSVEGVG